ncbi:thiamine-phosphate kinase [Ponticaulis sp.]|uniref:thiamine-phosphate kinase n=1 Tax=Ponticaulis sp. TaxID=2020902 RepID=UPI00260EAAB6|nr:thiamine-phosphate kinase [Ponticaulis sp.]MDF1681374.1 thiamine-phosphate kinase [Ponticaulis sp.]
MKEFEFIRTLLSPLAQSRGAASLKDDVALLDSGLIVTTDTLVEGVHFLSADPLETVGKKLVRVNVSDCIAKGALPHQALFNLVWPASRSDEELHALVNGLGSDLRAFDIDLIGGDTTSSPGRLVLSVTLLGCPVGDNVPRRGDALEGDDIWITGVIGHGVSGLRAIERNLESDFPQSVLHYRVPQLPSLEIAHLIAQYANASADISDGLVADLGNICDASECGATIRLSNIPLVQNVSSLDLSSGDLLSGGDDYQCLFTAPQGRRGTIESKTRQTNLAVTRIGRCEAGRGVNLLDANGMPIKLLKTGWEHGGNS